MTEGIITSAITKFLELTPRYLAVVAFAIGVILFGSPETVKALGLADVAQNYRPWLGGAFLLSTGMTIASWLTFAGGRCIVPWITKQITAYRCKKHIAKRLGALTEDEKKILRFYISKKTRTNRLKSDDGVVNGLADEGIIYRAASMGNLEEGFDYNITDTAWAHLNEHEGLLVGVTTDVRSDKRTGVW